MFGRHILGFALALLALATAPAAHAQTSRLQALDTENEARVWQAVGRLDLPGGFCTATLIAPDLVLTAAHCVYELGEGQALDPREMQFRAGYRDGNATAMRRVLYMAAHPDFAPDGEITPENVSHDLALLQLDQPIPSHEIDAFLLHDEAVRPGPVSVVSYGLGRHDRPSRQHECNLTREYQGVFIFDCSATFGTSGAPVFSHLNGRGRILSVISATVELDGERLSIGPDLAPLVERLKRDLRAQASAPVARRKLIGVGQSTENGAKFVRANP